MVRRLILTVFATGMLLGSQASTAGASLSWGDDPPLLVVTPSGHVAAVYATTYSDLFKSPCVDLAWYSAMTTPGEQQGTTAVDVSVQVPAFCGPFSYKTYVTTGPFNSGGLYASGSGYSGNTLHVRFNLQEP